MNALNKLHNEMVMKIIESNRLEREAKANMTTTTTVDSYRILATELRDFLMTDTASRMHPEAHVMAGWLTILLTSCTPDEANELLEGEYNSILSILGVEGRA